LPDLWLIVRLDGRGFGRFTAARFEKPFDPRVRDLMCVAARALLIDFNELYAYTMSDEISLLLPPEWDLFGRVVEKIVSISSGLASAAFTQPCGEPTHFDSGIWLGVNEEAVIDYFRWRHRSCRTAQADSEHGTSGERGLRRALHKILLATGRSA
jgi:tRNA(His) 5'-end guanylyltransferase